MTYPMQASDGSFNAKTEGIQATVDTSQLGAGATSSLSKARMRTAIGEFQRGLPYRGG